MEGSGKMVVTAVGVNSQAGIIMALLGATEEPQPATNNANQNGEGWSAVGTSTPSLVSRRLITIVSP